MEFQKCLYLEEHIIRERLFETILLLKSLLAVVVSEPIRTTGAPSHSSRSRKSI